MQAFISYAIFGSYICRKELTIPKTIILVSTTCMIPAFENYIAQKHYIVYRA